MRGYVTRHHSASADERIRADCDAANDGCVGADGGSALNQGSAEFVLAAHVGARIDDIGENATRAAKHVVLEIHALIERDVVLDLAAVADPHVWASHDILA